jgi:hypothetical protein
MNEDEQDAVEQQWINLTLTTTRYSNYYSLLG